MKLLSIALAAQAVALPAFSARYIVKFKDENNVQKVQSEFQKYSTQNSFDLFGARFKSNKINLLGLNALAVRSLNRLNLVSVNVNTKEDAAKLQRNPLVAYAEPEFFVQAPPAIKDNLDGSEVTWGLNAIDAQGAWAAGARGQGVRVAVIDTGIDKDHPDLVGNFMEGKSFLNRSESEGPLSKNPGIMGSFLLEEILDSEEGSELPYEYFDDVGHGTHVAGTIAGIENGVGVVGVAPAAKILAGKVCSRIGCSSIAILNGLNWALEKKVDVVNMSLGGPVPSRAHSDACQALENAGIVVVAASGNDGDSEKNKISFPAGYPSVFSVGAVTPELTRASFSQYGPNLQITAPGTEVISSVPVGTGRESKVLIHQGGTDAQVKSTSFVGSLDNESPLTGELVPAGLGKPEDFSNAAAYKGKIALIARGEIPFAEKVQNALEAGVIGVVVYNNTSGLISGSITQDGSTLSIPVAMVEKTVGETAVQAINKGESVTASISVARTDYAAFAGTSMASPHVAGVAALVKSANRSLTPQQLKGLLKTSATPVASPSGDNEYGAGIVNAGRAVNSALQLQNTIRMPTLVNR
jgi:subtilisin family serine protease